jgi:predicted dehydrogenase
MIWLVGSGPMSVDYAKILEAQNRDYLVIGRGKASAEEFTNKTSKEVVLGGLEAFLKTTTERPEAAIVSVGVAQLYSTTLKLIENGVKRILVEKPGGTTSAELNTLQQQSIEYRCDVFIAYNRRFFASVIALREKLKAEGGVTSFNFELTEWAHVIEKLDKPKDVLSKWFLANSTHVADLAFYLGGQPKEMASFVTGGLNWHPTSSIFSGAGVSESGALFNYTANWESAGRWWVEVLTKENRYILKPMESLLVQKRGTITQFSVEIDDSLDKEFKPGLYKQLVMFLNGEVANLCTLEEQCQMYSFYKKMANYTE